MRPRTVLILMGFALAAGCGCEDQESGEAWQFPDFDEEECVAAPCDEVPNQQGEGGNPDNPPPPPPPPPPAPDCSNNPPDETQLTGPEEDAVRTSMTLGPNDCPSLSWAADNAVFYASWDGVEWTTERAFGSAGWSHTLDVDAQGVPTLYVVRDDAPGFVTVRREGGTWVEKDSSGSRWVWGIHDISGGILSAVTATQQYSGTDLALNLLTRRDDEWVWTRIVDFEVTNLGAPRPAFDASGRAALPVLENKGYGPTNLETNLWLAESIDANLDSWTALRVAFGTYNEVRRARAYTVQSQLHLLILATTHPEHAPLQIVHGWRTDDGSWVVDPMEDCVEGGCRVSASRTDADGRLHILRGLGTDGDGYEVEHGVWDSGEWQFRALGRFETVPWFIGLNSESELRHTAVIRRPGPQIRSLVYVPVPAED